MEDKEFLKQLGLRLKCQRIMKELSVNEVSKKTGLHAATINMMERGAKDFHVLNLKRIASAYGMDIKEII
jgi:transcriptional regulator with XRE-family HTH domain